MKSGPLLFESHVHTNFSDGMNFKLMLKAAVKLKIDVIAITDHNTMAGIKPASSFVKLLNKKYGSNLILIPSEEIEVDNGIEILACFLNEPIKAKLSMGETIDKKAIILCCLFHDAAKLMKFDLTKLKLFEEEAKNIDYWRRVQKELIQKYGDVEHKATIQMCKEMGLPKRAIELIDNLEWSYIPKILKNNNFESAITVYADMRIGPFGTLLLKDRLRELRNRVNMENFNELVRQAKALEKSLQQHLSIKVNNIKDSQINNRFEKLLNLQV